ncbi:endothelin-converting enzyme 1-like [Amblyomma americanum]
MDLDPPPMDSTKTSKAFRASKKAKKKVAQQSKDTEREKDSSRTSRKKRKIGAERSPERHSGTRTQEVADERNQASDQAGTHEALADTPTIKAADVPGTTTTDEQPTLSQLPTAEHGDGTAMRLQPQGLTETEGTNMPHSSEGQALLPTASDDLAAAPSGAPADLTTVPAEPVESADTEPHHTTRTIRKVTRAQASVEAEETIKPSCHEDQPSARSQSAQAQPTVERTQDGKKPPGFRMMSPDVPKRSTCIKCCAGTSCVLLAVIVAVHLALRAPSRERHYETCDTLACAAYSKRLLETINSSVKPCDSFTHYVCDGWNSRYEASVHDVALLSALTRMYYIVRDMNVPKSGQNIMERAAAFYLSCECVGKARCNELLNVAVVLEAANVVWPLKAQRPDLLHTLLHVSIRLGWAGILAFEVKATGPKKYVLLRPPQEFYILGQRAKEQLRSPGSRQHYFEVLKTSLKAASSAAVHGDSVTFEETRNIELKIWDDLWKRAALHPTSIMKEGLFYNFVPNLTLERWKQALRDYRVGLREDERVVFMSDSIPFVHAFFNMWKKYGEEEMHLLLSWCTVQVAAWFANQELLINFYGTEQKVEIVHRAFCFSKTFVVTGDALLHRFSDATLPARIRPQARALILDVRQSLHGRLLRWKFYDENLTVVHNWNSTSVALLYFKKPGGGDSDDKSEATDGHQEGLVDMGESLVANWQLAAQGSFLNPSSWRLSKVIQELGLYVLHADTEEPDASLLPYAFSFPYFDHGATDALNYAGIGSRVAEALSQLFFSAYFTSPEALDAFKNQFHCMENSTSNKIYRRSYAPYLEPLSLKTALYAYRARNAATDVRVRGLEFLTPEQLFFVAACYVRCVRPSGPPGTVDGQCDKTFQHVAEFADAFQCAPGTRMNPSHRCELL